MASRRPRGRTSKARRQAGRAAAAAGGRQIKLAFDEEGIEIPFPHRVYVLRHDNGEPFADAGGTGEDGYTKAQGKN